MNTRIYNFRKTDRLDSGVLSSCWAIVPGILFCFWLLAKGDEMYRPVAPPVIPDVMTNLVNFGGVGDGNALNTEAFAKAIAALSEQGGGELVVPPGFWLTGPIQMRSNINLHLERGALVKFSGDFKLYPLAVIDMKGVKEVDSTSPISGQNLENVAITGEGILTAAGMRGIGQLTGTADLWHPTRR